MWHRLAGLLLCQSVINWYQYNLLQNNALNELYFFKEIPSSILHSTLRITSSQLQLFKKSLRKTYRCKFLNCEEWLSAALKSPCTALESSVAPIVVVALLFIGVVNVTLLLAVIFELALSAVSWINTVRCKQWHQHAYINTSHI